MEFNRWATTDGGGRQLSEAPQVESPVNVTECVDQPAGTVLTSCCPVVGKAVESVEVAESLCKQAICNVSVSLLHLPFPMEGPSPLNPGDSRWKWSKAEESAPQQWAHETGVPGPQRTCNYRTRYVGLGTTAQSHCHVSEIPPLCQVPQARPTRLAQIKGRFLFFLVVGLSGAAEERLQMVHYAYAVHRLVHTWHSAPPSPDRNFQLSPSNASPPSTIERQPELSLETLTSFVLSPFFLHPVSAHGRVGAWIQATAINDLTKKMMAPRFWRGRKLAGVEATGEHLKRNGAGVSCGPLRAKTGGCFPCIAPQLPLPAGRTVSLRIERIWPPISDATCRPIILAAFSTASVCCCVSRPTPSQLLQLDLFSDSSQNPTGPGPRQARAKMGPSTRNHARLTMICHLPHLPSPGCAARRKP